MPYFVALFEMIDKDKDKDILDVHIDFLNENIKKRKYFCKRPIYGPFWRSRDLQNENF